MDVNGAELRESGYREEGDVKHFLIEPLMWGHGGKSSSYQAYPEKKLMAAVLAQALKDTMEERVSTFGGKYSTTQQKEETVVWFASNDRTVYSYEWICNSLGIDPDRLRYWIKNTCPGLTGKQKRQISRDLALMMLRE